MPVASIQNFAGMLPMKDASVLPDNNASYCSNAWLYGGTVQGFRETNSVHTIQGINISSVYRIPRADADPLDFAGSLWLEFSDPYLAVARAPVIEDQFRRYYFFPSDQAAANEGPYYNTYHRLLTGARGYTLGIPAPVTAPGITYTGGTPATQEVRAYVYTWVSAFGEEGPPSPPSVLKGTVDGTWRVRVYVPRVSANKHRSLATTNIYRTVTGSDGSVNYYFVGSIDIAATTFNDNYLSTSITGNTILPSVTWTAPPADLQGVVVMANGILAGWSNKREVWFCEPYRPHAWPAAYAVAVDSPIVALAAVGTSLVILTESTPWIATGVTPASITLGQIKSREPCISRGSVAPAGEGVFYASPNGLIMVNTMGTTNVTQLFIDKENWNKTGASSFAASRYQLAYVAFAKDSHASDNGVVIDQTTSLGSYSAIAAFSWLSSGSKVLNVYSDEFSGSTFLLTDTSVIEWNPATKAKRLPYKWASRSWRFPYPQQFVGGMIYFDVPPEVTISPPTPATRKASQNQDFDPTSQYLLLRVFADERLVLVREIQVSGELVLFPSGFKATYWRLQFDGQVKIKEAKFATSVKELMLA